MEVWLRTFFRLYRLFLRNLLRCDENKQRPEEKVLSIEINR